VDYQHNEVGDRVIQFTPEKIAALKAAYSSAMAEGRPMFSFEGRTIVTSYAKYLLEYLNSPLPSTRRRRLIF
jgi:hypothetical protein